MHAARFEQQQQKKTDEANFPRRLQSDKGFTSLRLLAKTQWDNPKPHPGTPQATTRAAVMNPKGWVPGRPPEASATAPAHLKDCWGHEACGFEPSEGAHGLPCMRLARFRSISSPPWGDVTPAGRGVRLRVLSGWEPIAGWDMFPFQGPGVCPMWEPKAAGSPLRTLQLRSCLWRAAAAVQAAGRTYLSTSLVSTS